MNGRRGEGLKEEGVILMEQTGWGRAGSGGGLHNRNREDEGGIGGGGVPKVAAEGFEGGTGGAGG